MGTEQQVSRQNRSYSQQNHSENDESEDSAKGKQFPHACLILVEPIENENWVKRIVLHKSQTFVVGQREDDTGSLSDCGTTSRRQFILRQKMLSGGIFTLQIEATKAPSSTQVNGVDMAFGDKRTLKIGDSVMIAEHKPSYRVELFTCQKECRLRELEQKVQELLKENTQLREQITKDRVPKRQLSQDPIECNNKTMKCRACTQDRNSGRTDSNMVHDTDRPDCWFQL